MSDLAKRMSGGPLHGVRVVELASFWGAWSGKLLGDMGADVVVVEPPGGHFTRSFGPFADDVVHPDRSLWWWHYNSSKRGVVLDLDTPEGAAEFRRLVADADIVLEGESPGRLGELGLDHADLRAGRPELIWTSVTSHGRGSDRSTEAWTDLTIAAASGIAWMNGYDDHSLPPMRARGNQTVHIAGVHGAMATLTALVHRDLSGSGQHIDVSAYAACNVSTEMGTVAWMVAGDIVQRQTGRHATTQLSMPVQTQAADGRHVSTGFPPMEGKDFQVLLDWLDELGLRDTFFEAPFLEFGVERGGIDVRKGPLDDEGMAIFAAGRSALVHIAQHLSAVEFFEGAQKRDFQCGMILSPEEAFEHPHFVARGLQRSIRHEELGRDVRYVGPAFQMSASPGGVHRPAPLLGEPSPPSGA